MANRRQPEVTSIEQRAAAIAEQLAESYRLASELMEDISPDEEPQCEVSNVGHRPAKQVSAQDELARVFTHEAKVQSRRQLFQDPWRGR